MSFSPRADEKISGRTSPVRSWYLDLSLVKRYWSSDRVYHHTASSNLGYALYEGLRMVLEEGLDARHARHLRHHHALRAGLVLARADLAEESGPAALLARNLRFSPSRARLTIYAGFAALALALGVRLGAQAETVVPRKGPKFCDCKRVV